MNPVPGPQAGASQFLILIARRLLVSHTTQHKRLLLIHHNQDRVLAPGTFFHPAILQGVQQLQPCLHLAPHSDAVLDLAFLLGVRVEAARRSPAGAPQTFLTVVSGLLLSACLGQREGLRHIHGLKGSY